MTLARYIAVAIVSSSLAAAAGCGGGGATPGGADMAPPAADVYTPFSASNLLAQQARVGVYEEISAFRKAMGFDKTKCGEADRPAPGTLAEIYTRNDATGGVLREKVKGRTDDHDYNKDGAIGVKMDELVARALADCNAGTLDPVLAGQIVEKNLQWFFYASVFHELTLGAKNDAESKEKWDEAFGYYGRSFDGAKSLGIAKTAQSRDENFKTNLNDRVWKGLIAGRAQLAAGDAAGLVATAKKIDQDLLVIFAYSTAREFALIPGGGAKAAEYLAEGVSFWNTLEPYMKSAAAADAAFIRGEIDKANYAMPAAIDHAGITARIEKAFGIDVTP